MGKMTGVKLGIIGCGNYADSLATAVRKCQQADLVSCFDVIAERSQKFSNRYQCEMEKSYENLLKRKDVDGVLLVTPNVEHADQTVKAADFGKHFFVEKPIANTIFDAKRMITACKKSNVILMVRYLGRRSAGIGKAKTFIGGRKYQKSGYGRSECVQRLRLQLNARQISMVG